MKVLAPLITALTKPGCSSVVSDPEKTSFFWANVRSMHGIRLLPLPAAQADFSAWSGMRMQSFLGNCQRYWCVLPASSAKPSKVVQQALAFLSSYDGPHTVFVQVSGDQAAALAERPRIPVPESIAVGQFSEFADFFNCGRSIKVIEALGVTGLKTLSLDDALSLVLHATFLPVKDREASSAFLHKLVPYETSLSLLSELFFKKEWPAFLKAWQAIESGYGDVFWTSFWAEQLWRAYWVRVYLKRGQQAKARSMAYRLPATFVQQGWKLFSGRALLQAAEYTVFFDSQFKRGAAAGASDLVTLLSSIVS
jgi:hypothetical protein